MVRLRLLGGAMVEDENGVCEGTMARRHPIALLAVLAADPAGSVGRSKTVGLLWPESPEDRARGRLNSCLYRVRRQLGKEAVLSVGDDLMLDREVVRSDVQDFETALEGGDPEGAASAYGGPFLEGFRLPRSAPFERWSDRTGARLERKYRESLLALAEEAEATDRTADTIGWWRELTELDPYDSGVALRLARALAATGRRGDALRAVERHLRDLRKDLGADPPGDLEALLEELRQARSRAPARATPPSPSVAVVPFETLSTPDAAFSGDVVHSGILTRLSMISGLDVIARTSVRQYRDTDEPASEIGRALGVEWVVEGDVQEGAGKLRVRVRLVDAASDRQAWASSFARSIYETGLFDAQAEIVKEIVDALHVEITPQERRDVERRPTESSEAYRLFVEGRMHLDRRSEEAMRQALDAFERALEMDADFVVARVGVADALGLLHAYGHVGPEDALPRAEEEIRRALDLDPRSAEAHAALGRLLGQRNEALAANRELKLALELKPSYAEAHNWLTVGNHVIGRPGAALASARRAVILNPLSPEAIHNLAVSHLVTGDHSAALREAKRALGIAPEYNSAEFVRGVALYEMGRHKEADTALRDLPVPWAPAAPRSVRALALSGLGDLEGARDLLRAVETVPAPFDSGLVHLALGEAERAFEAFERADFRSLDMGSSYWPTLSIRYLFTRVWNDVREDSRYHDLLRKVDRSWGIDSDSA